MEGRAHFMRALPGGPDLRGLPHLRLSASPPMRGTGLERKSTAAHSALARGQAPFSQARGKFKTLFDLKLPLSIRSTR
jgi:hypothetical protein